ncbi:MAG: hypothetical protein QXW39_08185 [Candidatus Bathyarchaeia archaeon]
MTKKDAKSVQVKLSISKVLADEIDKAMRGLYRYRQEFITEAVIEKIRKIQDKEEGG